MAKQFRSTPPKRLAEGAGPVHLCEYRQSRPLYSTCAH